MDELELNLKSATWEEVRDDIKKHDAELSKIIDALSPSKDCKFYITPYSYGDEIINKNGIFQIPTKQGLFVPIDHPGIPPFIKDQLGYNFSSNPVGISLDKSLELYINMDSKLIPFACIKPGKLFGTWKILDDEISHCPPTFAWGMTAGARNIFSLAKISESISHRRIVAKYETRADKPETFMDHGEIFRDIAAHPNFPGHWESRLVFFSKEWFEKLEDTAWHEFHRYLLKKSWKSTEFWRNRFIWDLTFTRIRNKKNIRPSPHVDDIVKYLFDISVGAIPGFSPAVDEEFSPVFGLQDAYLNDYQLKEHLPIMMQPSQFSLGNNSEPVYASLQHLLPINLSLKNNIRASAIDILCQTESLLRKYLDEIQTGNLNIGTTPLSKIPESVEFEFFHNQTDQFSKIKENVEIPRLDSRFLLVKGKTLSDRTFPFRSSFVQGCIKVSLK